MPSVWRTPTRCRDGRGSAGQRSRHLATAVRLVFLACALAAIAEACGCGTAPGASGGKGQNGPALASDEEIEPTLSCISPSGDLAALFVWSTHSWRFLFFDLRRGVIVGTTPSEWKPKVLKWGPGRSYLELAHAPSESDPLKLHWARTPEEEPKVLAEAGAGVAPLPRYEWGGFALDPGGKNAIVTFLPDREGGGRRWAVYALPVAGGKPRLVSSFAEDGELVAVIPDPKDPGAALTLVDTSAPDGPSPQLEAISCHTGQVRWRAAMEPPPGKAARVESLATYGEHQAVLAQQIQPETPDDLTLSSSAPHDTTTRIWTLDTTTGTLRFVAEVPQGGVHHLLAVTTPNAKLSFLAMDPVDVWGIERAGPRAHVSRLIEGRDGNPIGAVLDPQRGPEVYFITSRALWRCRLRDGSLTRIWGNASSDPYDLPPRLVGGR